MRILILACIFLLSSCQDRHYFHYKEGRLAYNTQVSTVTEGPVLIEGQIAFAIAGMHVCDGTKTPFWLGGEIKSYKNNNGHIEITAAFIKGNWGTQEIQIVGSATIVGTWQEATFTSTFTTIDNKDRWELNARITHSMFFSYSLAEAAVRAKVLIGESGINYPSGKILAYAGFGTPFTNGVSNCGWYLSTKDASDNTPGAAIVARDGAYCAILSASGTTFIHSNPINNVVTETPMTMIHAFFRNGYKLKDYSGLI